MAPIHRILPHQNHQPCICTPLLQVWSAMLLCEETQPARERGKLNKIWFNHNHCCPWRKHNFEAWNWPDQSMGSRLFCDAPKATHPLKCKTELNKRDGICIHTIYKKILCMHAYILYFYWYKCEYCTDGLQHPSGTRFHQSFLQQCSLAASMRHGFMWPIKAQGWPTLGGTAVLARALMRQVQTLAKFKEALCKVESGYRLLCQFGACLEWPAPRFVQMEVRNWHAGRA